MQPVVAVTPERRGGTRRSPLPSQRAHRAVHQVAQADGSKPRAVLEVDRVPEPSCAEYTLIAPASPTWDQLRWSRCRCPGAARRPGSQPSPKALAAVVLVQWIDQHFIRRGSDEFRPETSLPLLGAREGSGVVDRRLVLCCVVDAHPALGLTRCSETAQLGDAVG